MDDLRLFLIYVVLIAGTLAGCTDRESEELIEGSWQAVIMKEVGESRSHELPEGIVLDFEYPKYSFEGEQSEQGNYYIKNDQLHLIPEEQDEKRAITILQLSSDSLSLKLIDSLGSRSVLFLRN